jgi:hypothetical protein
MVRWEGVVNARDLGGLPTRNGRTTRHGAYYRAGDPRLITTAGWDAARAAGLRTVVDLRNPDEIRPGLPDATAAAGTYRVAAPEGGPADVPGIRRVEVPVDDITDDELWRKINGSGLNGTPLYFGPFLDAKPGRVAGAVTALARAEPGGTLFHCAAGRDRTGLVALVLLALAGVEPDAIADDYTQSLAALVPVYAAMAVPDQTPRIEGVLAAHATTAHRAVLDLVAGLDAEAYLVAAGVIPADLATIRRRLLGEDDA